MSIFFEALKKELFRPLPGLEAQMKMAPMKRQTQENRISQNAAVSVIILHSEQGEKEILLIKRAKYDGHHSGQVGFPGGKEEPKDNDLIQTSIRECHEEIGVHLSLKNYLGNLTPLPIPVSQFLVFPFVFYLNSPPFISIDKQEVDYTIRYPLKNLMSKELICQTELPSQGNTMKIPYYSILNEIVWGATAMILSELIEIVKSMTKDNPKILG